MGKPIEIETAIVRAFIAEETERGEEQSDAVFPDSSGVTDASQRHLDLATSRSAYPFEIRRGPKLSPGSRRVLREGLARIAKQRRDLDVVAIDPDEDFQLP